MATKKSAVKDLTNGSPVKLILGFALPLLLALCRSRFAVLSYFANSFFFH